jgi:hypothetical protein
MDKTTIHGGYHAYVIVSTLDTMAKLIQFIYLDCSRQYL